MWWYSREFSQLCPGLNVVTNFAIFRLSFKCNKFCDFSLISKRYTKIRCLDDFSVRWNEIYNFMLIDKQAPACGFYKVYKLNLRFFATCDFLHFFVMQILPTSADLWILKKLWFFAVNITQKDRQRRQACLCSHWNEKAGWKYAIILHQTHKTW